MSLVSLPPRERRGTGRYVVSSLLSISYRIVLYRMVSSTTHWHAAMALAGSTLKALIFSSNVASLNLATFVRASSTTWSSGSLACVRHSCAPTHPR